ncbi:MAG: aspartate aminotransferase family protein [Rhodothalassiaceae bacterium]
MPARRLSSERLQALVAADSRHHLHPFTAHRELRAAGPRVITGAEGVHLIDAEGKRILDGMAGLWCVQVGYGQESLAEAGYKALKELPYYNVFFQCTHPYVAELSESLSDVMPHDLRHFFFANSGSEANDSAVKLIRYYWNLMGRPEKKQIIARDWAYHGVTLAAASLSGLPHMHPQFDLPLAGFHHVGPPPYRYGFGGDMSEAEFADLCLANLEAKILEIGPERVAAFIGEPAMGAGGMMTPPDGYWPRVEALCRKYDILLWADEVICGFGRTGEWFGCETYGFRPDIVTMAKGMSSGYQPISAVALGERVGAVIAASEQEMAHGFTWSGHPVASAVSTANLALMHKLELVGDEARVRAAQFQEAIATLADHPLVGEVRGIGFLGAIELVADRTTRRRHEPLGRAGGLCRDACIRNGLVMRAVRDTMVLSPPLVISPDEIGELVEKARRALDDTMKDLGTK